MEHPKSSEVLSSRMRLGGMLLFFACFLLWLYRHDLHPVNYIFVVLLMFRAVLLKTKVDFPPSCDGCKIPLGAKRQRFRYRIALSK